MPTENIASATRIRELTQLEPADGEPEIDGEAGEGSQQRGFGERHQRFRSS